MAAVGRLPAGAGLGYCVETLGLWFVLGGFLGNDAMLLPRYSLRTTLLGITGFAFFFVVLGQAVRGAPWAVVISVACVSLMLIFVFHALLYVVATVFARLVGTQQQPARTFQGGMQLSSDEQSPPLDASTEGDPRDGATT